MPTRAVAALQGVEFDLNRLRDARVVLGALGVVAAMDGLTLALDPGFAVLGLLDEPAHMATGILVLAALVGGRRSGSWVLAFWLGAVGIDLDHIPLALGSQIISHGTGRPYTHSLLSIVVALAVARAWPRGRTVAVAFSIGLVTHFSRDLATGGGVALLWPFEDVRFVLPYVVWFAGLAVLARVAVRRREVLAAHVHQ